MKIQTSRFGEVDLPEERVLTFPEGFPGFEGKQFALIDAEQIEWLQSMSEPEVAMMVLDPARYPLDYQPKPKEAELSPIRPDGPEDAISFRVVIRNGERPGQAFLNLFAPILINFSKSLAMQVPLVGSGYAVREPWPSSDDQ